MKPRQTYHTSGVTVYSVDLTTLSTEMLLAAKEAIVNLKREQPDADFGPEALAQHAQIDEILASRSV